MEELINLLHTGGYSCTIANKGEIRTFTQRGVADIYDLLTQEPEFLKGASIADKVVGKGAAALMILGGIKELYTDIISTKALELLQKSDIKVGFTEKVPFIDAPLLGWGERSECFLQFSSALLLLLQVFGCFVVEQISFIFRGQGVI